MQHVTAQLIGTLEHGVTVFTAIFRVLATCLRVTRKLTRVFVPAAALGANQVASWIRGHVPVF